MSRKFGLLFLFVSLLAFTQSRPTGGNVLKDMANVDAGISSMVDMSLIACDAQSSKHKSVKNVHEMYQLFEKLQTYYLVKSWPEVVMDKEKDICEATASHLSPKIACLLRNNEVIFYSFVHNKHFNEYLQKELKLKADEAKKVEEFMRAIGKSLTEARNKGTEVK